MDDHEKARYASRGDRANPNSFPTSYAQIVAASRRLLPQAEHCDLGITDDDGHAVGT